MKIYFENIRSGWATVRFFHKDYRDIVIVNSATGEKTFIKEDALEYTEGKFTVSYAFGCPFSSLNKLKSAAEKEESCQIEFDAEGEDSIIYLHHIAGEYFKFIWENNWGEFGGISVVKKDEIIAAVNDLNFFVGENALEIEKNFWMNDPENDVDNGGEPTTT